MERLTHYYNGKVAEPYNRTEALNMANKLADYEDTEENGLLVRLPCAINQKLYFVFDLCLNYKFSGWTKEQRDKYNGKIISDKVSSISVTLFEEGKKIIIIRTRRFNLSFDTDDIGKTVFFTHEAAEQALEERENA